MKRQLLATVSCLALTGFAAADVALAADMPVKAPPRPVIAQTWAGPYVGLNGGAVWHQLDTDTTLSGFGAYDTAKLRATGATFGGQIGYNWQSQNFVYGLEADLNWVDARESESQTPFASSLTYTTKLTWLATVRARAGVAFGQSLLYATGGLAVGGVDDSWHFSSGSCCVVRSDETRTGWTAGGGIEHMISNSRLTVKAEALYVDLGSKTQAGTGSYTSRFKDTAVIGRLGVNLKW